MRTKVFLDTNILMDLMVPNRPFTKESMMVLAAVQSHMVEAQVSTQSIIDCAYSSRKAGVKLQDFTAFIRELEQYVNIGYVDSFDLDLAMAEPNGDLEDDAQFSCAYRSCCDFFLTNDRGLLERPENANLKVMTPQAFVAEMQRED